MSLEQWLRNAWLQSSDPTLPEIAQLLRVVDREISDAGTGGLSPDGRFMHAYDAACYYASWLFARRDTVFRKDRDITNGCSRAWN